MDRRFTFPLLSFTLPLCWFISSLSICVHLVTTILPRITTAHTPQDIFLLYLSLTTHSLHSLPQLFAFTVILPRMFSHYFISNCQWILLCSGKDVPSSLLPFTIGRKATTGMSECIKSVRSLRLRRRFMRRYRVLSVSYCP